MTGTDAKTPPLTAGLCTTCQHSRAVTSSRGSTFVLCERSKADARFPRYPPLPVTSCIGYEPWDTQDAQRDLTRFRGKVKFSIDIDRLRQD